MLFQSVIAKARHLSESTVYSHLSEACRAGLPVDLGLLQVTPEIVETVRRVVREPPICSGRTFELVWLRVVWTRSAAKDGLLRASTEYYIRYRGFLSSYDPGLSQIRPEG